MIVQRGSVNPWAVGCLSRDLFDPVLAPGDLTFFVTWKDGAAADACVHPLMLQDDARLRWVQVIRDYVKHRNTTRMRQAQEQPTSKATPKAVSRRRATNRSRATVDLAEPPEASIKPSANHHSTISSGSLRRPARSDRRRRGR